MTPELIYMLKVNAGFALFYAFYKLFCCRDTFFQWRRMALLSFLTVSFLYPLLNIQNWVKEQPAMNDLADYYAMLVMSDGAMPVEVSPNTLIQPTPPDIMQILLLIYYIGIGVLILRFIIQLCSILYLAMGSKAEVIGNSTIRSLRRPANPFSFFRWIFIYTSHVEKEEMKEIMTHEQTHVRQWHSIDVIISELISILCWPNPFIWLLKAEIRQNLEYLADHKVVESGADTRRYQYHLLGLANQKKQTGLYNNFNFSNLKNRIIMMNKERTRTAGRIKYALFAPLTIALLLVSNIEAVARTAERLMRPAEETLSMVEAPIAETEGVAEVVTYTITVTNSEGKPQPNITIQTQINGELKNAQTNASGVATITLDMSNLKHATFKAFAPNKQKSGTIFSLSPQKLEKTIVVDTEADIAAYAKAKKEILVKLRVMNNDSQPISNATLTSSATKQVAKTNDKGIAEMRTGVLDRITVSQDGYQDGAFEVSKQRPLADMTSPGSIILLKAGEKPVFQVVEVMPEFPGGMKACLDYVGKNIQYPAEAMKNGVQGRVVIQFTIEEDGSISNPSIVRSVSEELDKEAIRLVKNMPKWKPGMQRGNVVRCKYTIPIAFNLQ